MSRYKNFINLIVFAFIVLLTYNPSYNVFTTNDVESLKSVSVMNINDSLYKEIETKKSKYEVEPQDAFIDEVWHKTPGLNGLQVDIEKSYNKMKKQGEFSESLLVYKQVPPKVSLEDLPASPIYRGHPEKKMVSFLINVSWGGEFIPDILTILKKNNVKATFFIEGKWAKENANYVKMINEQGHTIGNHAYNHPDMARLSNTAISKQLTQTNDVLEAITGKKTKWFAPPSGSFSDQVVKTANQLDMETILWTVDTIDWKNPSVSVMMNRVTRKIHPGATILMHPTSSIVNGLPNLIEEIRNQGYKLGSIEQLLDEKR
ncbi:polysaccharide deacetylase family protein [Ornithinibacillus halophilus]|uniref:Probable sporulation protein, polysaccharide deacetylase family n=1 Tax=Ornithinibacillus halophilus TaxID=930117 RepID=A0A1M5CDL1_9BACI|nr:polysaccharide deacetylase family protein [Ornithinibacillus halophilus]SHF52687.1 probable sporulation protein, polysaccharide deacetylase family [Ornithinibacillus halophilus]